MVTGFQRSLLALMLVIVSGLSQAATIQGLYIAELLVPVQQAQPQASELRQALRQVLVKVSGSSLVINKPAVAVAMQQPEKLMQQFSYQATQTPVAAGDGREVLGQRLVIEFDPVQLDQLLSLAGVPVIGHARPEMLVWLVASQGGDERDFLAPDGRIYSELNGFAQQRGMPMVAPLLDLVDQQALSVSDIWGFFDASVQAASERYQPDAVLAGRLIQRSSGGWQTEWRLYSGSQVRSLQPSGTLSQQLQLAVDEAADQVLGALTQSGFSYQETGLQLEVANVNSITDFVQLVEYVRELPPVESAIVSRVDADRTVLRIELQGGEAALEQAVRLNPRMTATTRLAVDSQSAGLFYRWQE